MKPSSADGPLTITWLVKRFWPEVGGVEKYVLEVGRELAEMGHSVRVVAGDPTGSHARHERHAGLSIHRYPSRRSPWRAAWGLRALTPLFRQADVVHISDVEMFERYEAVLSRGVGARPVFLTRHGMGLGEPVSQEDRERHRRARAVVAGLLDDGMFIQRRYGQTPDRVPDPGLRPVADEIIHRPPPAEPSAVFIGRLEPDSGIDLYLDALARLRDRHGTILPLGVYGDGSLKPRLIERAMRERLDVAWRPPAPDAQDRLLDGTLAFVSGRMAIFEAMARRRPVVAAYVDPLKRDYVCGEWFSRHVSAGASGADLADRVLRLLRDARLRDQQAQAAFEEVRRLSWRATALQYLAVWRQDAQGQSGSHARHAGSAEGLPAVRETEPQGVACH
ncbi:MAG: glycosyltransferase family 4 protein [Phycisphaerales bacterium]|nr:glycosyltransferase family 4 protein [Phycisphaerales bacterium]